MEHLLPDNQIQLFLNALGRRRINNLTKENATFSSEIEEALTNCGEICRSHGSNANYVKELVEVEEQILKAERKSLTSAELGELSLRKESLNNKYNDFLEQLPLEERENIEFYFRRVVDRNTRINNNLEIIEEINKNYPDAKEVTLEDVRNITILRRIEEFLHPDEVRMEEEKEETLPVVEGIHQFEDAELIVPDESKLEIGEAEVDNGFFGEDQSDDLLNQIENPSIATHGFEEVEEPEVDEMPEAPKTDNDEEISQSNEDSEEKVTFEMEKGISLADLAFALCGDENGWFDIYNMNKDILEGRITEAGISHDEPFEHDNELFTGLTLTIPDVYKKESNGKILA